MHRKKDKICAIKICNIYCVFMFKELVEMWALLLFQLFSIDAF